MTDDQAERGIRELRGIRIGIFLAGVILAIFAGLKLGESFGPRDPTASLSSELSAIREELKLLRGELAKTTSPVLPPVPIPTNKPDAENAK
jgi:hypothetical protein